MKSLKMLLRFAIVGGLILLRAESMEEAVALSKRVAYAKFDETVEIARFTRHRIEQQILRNQISAGRKGGKKKGCNLENPNQTQVRATSSKHVHALVLRGPGVVPVLPETPV